MSKKAQNVSDNTFNGLKCLCVYAFAYCYYLFLNTYVGSLVYARNLQEYKTDINLNITTTLEAGIFVILG